MYNITPYKLNPFYISLLLFHFHMRDGYTATLLWAGDQPPLLLPYSWKHQAKSSGQHDPDIQLPPWPSEGGAGFNCTAGITLTPCLNIHPLHLLMLPVFLLASVRFWGPLFRATREVWVWGRIIFLTRATHYPPLGHLPRQPDRWDQESEVGGGLVERGGETIFNFQLIFNLN